MIYLVEENNCYAAKTIEAPKVLGDIFESVFCAIYLDCGQDLNVVWKICHGLLKDEIGKSSKLVSVV